MSLPEASKPTHILRIEVPLNLASESLREDIDPVRDAIGICLTVSRAAFAGHVCGNAELTLVVSKKDDDAA
jgi:hypothetical protein